MESIQGRYRENTASCATLIQEHAGWPGKHEAGCANPDVDCARVLSSESIANEIVIKPHEAAENVALTVPAGDDALHLGGGVYLVPQTGENRNASEIPSDAGIIPLASGVCLQVHSVHCARQLGVDLCHHVRPITAVDIRIWHHVITQLAEHHAKGNRGRRVVAVLIVKIDGIKSRDRRLQSGKILVEDAVGSGALGFN